MLDKIYNEGERLIPGESHDIFEVIRHKSSYKFFREIIESDILNNPMMLNNKIKILDIGCGTGHGTFMLGDIIGSEVTAIDISDESIMYAKENYSAENIKYLTSNLVDFIKISEGYDYIVSRHAIEHIPDGINAVLKFYHKKRLIINVPFNEPEGNIHHLINCITEKDFDAYQNKEFFYEGLDGITYPEYSEQNPPNSIICASSADGLSPIKNVINYQIPAWKPGFLENLCFTKAQEYESLQQKYQTLQQKYQTLQQENEQLKQAATYKVKNFIKSFIKHS